MAGVVKRLMSVPEAAVYLGVGQRTLWQRIKEGHLPAVRLGRRTLIDQQDLDHLITHMKEKKW